MTPLGLVLSSLAFSIVSFGQIIARTPQTVAYRAPQTVGDSLDNAELLEILLVASVDGMFHALSRKSGQKLWSMSSATSQPDDLSSPLSPLIRTQHSDVDSDLFDDSDPQETYIIEPQTGDIYVATSPTSPLRQLPYSVPQLAQNSPSYFALDENNERMVVSQIETSLLLIELETGKIKATINSQCLWNAFQDLQPEDLDLDDLESGESTPETTDVFIGRKDYKISILQKSGKHSPPVPIQNLSFSSYGPNNQDLDLQASYLRTKDQMYLQTLPDGSVLAIKSSTPNDASPNPTLWESEFHDPVVAVFDVLQNSKGPFVLLQPSPQLRDIFPSISEAEYPNNAFVGMVRDTGSLYALSPSNYPLVGFGHSQRGAFPAPGIEGSTPAATESHNICGSPEGALKDRRCMTGVKKLDFWSQDVPQQPLLPPARQDVPLIEGPILDNDSKPADPGPQSNTIIGQVGWRTTMLTLLFALGGMGAVFSRTVFRTTSPSPSTSDPVSPLPPVPETSAPVDVSLALPPEPRVHFSVAETSNGERDPTTLTTPRKGGVRRGGRGRRGKKKTPALEDEEESEIQAPPKEDVQATPRSNVSFMSSLPEPPEPKEPSLVVSDTILGFGSHGTVVFKGSLQGRAVAVKRLLQDFVTLASREVSILQESDYHPNVIRYYYQEAQGNFLYIALELCPASLADIIENPDRDEWRDIAISFDPKKALQQITAGLRHLHGLKLVHRDIKPQNILISAVKSIRDKPTYRMLISDFGLCKKLDLDQTSFLPTAHGSMAAGTVGWRAPEILRGEVKLDDISDENSSRGSISSINGTPRPSLGKPTRLTKSVDIFALGCLYYYTMTNGGHPYGDRFEREMNILKDAKSLEGLDRFGEEGSEALDLIGSMLSPDASLRPDTTTCLMHPFFWDSGRRLNFLQDASDRFEIMCRDPRDPNLITLEDGAREVVGSDWRNRLDKTFLENLGKFRKYDGASVQDLLRALRNKKNHYQDLPDHVKRTLGPLPDGFLSYFTRRYPRLFLHVHSVVSNSTLRTDPLFRSYFDLTE